MNNFLKGTICYTAGPMDFETTGYGLQWRAYLKSVLSEIGIKILSPYDDTLLNFPVETEETKAKLKELKAKKRFDEVHNLAKLIVRRDLAMVDKSDFLIANINPKIHMCGTYHEIATAKSEQKPIFIFCEDKTILPFWILGCIKPSFIFEDIKDIVNYLYKLNSGEENLDTKYWKVLRQNSLDWIENAK